MNKKILLLVLLVVGAGLAYVIYNKYYSDQCCTKTESSELIETPTEKFENKNTQTATTTKTVDLEGNPVTKKVIKTKTSKVSKTK